MPAGYQRKRQRVVPACPRPRAQKQMDRVHRAAQGESRTADDGLKRHQNPVTFRANQYPLNHVWIHKCGVHRVVCVCFC